MLLAWKCEVTFAYDNPGALLLLRFGLSVNPA